MVSRWSDQVTRICSLFREERFCWGPNLENALAFFLKPQCLTPSLVSEVLHKNRNYAPLAWNFFKWAGRAGACTYSLRHFRILSDILCHAKMVAELKELLENVPGEDSAIAVPALWTIAKSLAKAGLVDEAYTTFNELKKHDAVLTTRIYNVFLEAFLRKDRPEMISVLYREMLQRKIQPDTFTFNIMIRALCNVHKVDEAYHIVQKMGAKCCTPNVFTYSILAKGFCEINRVMHALGDRKSVV